MIQNGLYRELSIIPVTLLSILAHDAVALPLPQGFPANELRFIVKNSQTAIILSTPKFEDKVNEVLRDGFDEQKPTLKVSRRIEIGAEEEGEINLDQDVEGNGGFMLYTSGTTSRPVSSKCSCQICMLMGSTERGRSSYVGHQCSSSITDPGMDVCTV